jgi:hypothetical protein
MMVAMEVLQVGVCEDAIKEVKKKHIQRKEIFLINRNLYVELQS